MLLGLRVTNMGMGWRILTAVVLFGAFIQSALAQNFHNAQWNTSNQCVPTTNAPNISVDGQVNAIVTSGTTAYIGGNFTQVQGTDRRGVASINMSTGALLPFNPRLGGPSVDSLLLNGTTLYVGGQFRNVNSYQATSGAFVNSSGVASSSSPTINGTVTVAIPDGSSGWYIGGSFTLVNGVTRNRIARINSDGTIHAFDPNANSTVNSLLLNGTTLYVGGGFSTIGGASRAKIAALDTTLNTANATAWNPGVTTAGGNRGPYAMQMSGTILYIGGDFITAGGASRASIAALDTTINTGSATAWDPAPTNTTVPYILSLHLNGTTLYVGGGFTTIGGASRSNIAALDTTVNTGNATAWDPGSNVAVESMVRSGTTLYVAGGFGTIGGSARTGVAALDTTTNTNNATAWAPQISVTGTSLGISGTTLYMGSSTAYATNGVKRYYLLAFDTTLNSSNLLSWNPGANAQTNVIAVNGSDLFVGGNFSSIGGTIRSGLAAFDTTVNTDNATAWEPHIAGSVRGMALYNSTLYVIGSFSRVNNNISRRHLAGFDTTVNQDNHVTCGPGLTSGAAYYGTAIALNKDTLYVAGNYLTLGGAGNPRNSIAALDVSTCTVTSWNPDANGPVRALAVNGDNVYAGGDFTTIGGQTRNRVAALKSGVATNNATGWNPNVSDGSVRAIALDRNYAYIGGSFTTVGGTGRNFLAALQTTRATSNLLSWNPNPTGGTMVTSLLTKNNSVFIGGDFTAFDGSASRIRFGALSCSP